MPTIEANGFDALCKTTKRHAAALFFGEIADLIWKGSGRYIQAQGTITFIRYRNRCFGVTNDHVYHAPSSKVVAWHMALNTHQPFLQQPLFTSTKDNPDFPFDIALFELEEGVILRGGKIPVDVDQDALLAEGDPIMPDTTRRQFTDAFKSEAVRLRLRMHYHALTLLRDRRSQVRVLAGDPKSAMLVK